AAANPAAGLLAAPAHSATRTAIPARMPAFAPRVAGSAPDYVRSATARLPPPARPPPAAPHVRPGAWPASRWPAPAHAGDYFEISRRTVRRPRSASSATVRPRAD